MDKPLLTILTVNYNTADFIKLMLYALKQLTKNSYKVYILDNNSDIKDYKMLLSYTKEYDNVSVERNETNLKGSKAHGIALDYLTNKVDTKYFSVLDSDATWLIKGWDDILINKLDDKTKVIGTEAPGNKHKDFPLMFCILFETKTFKSLDISFLPHEPFDPLKDTGWQLRDKYLSSNYKGELIEFKNTRTYKKGPFKELLCAEFYLNGNYDEIFASHYGRGASLGANKYRNTKFRYLYMLPLIGSYFLKKKGKAEKQKWIDICTEIVYNQ